jgi:alpha-galactosidase
MSCKITLIGAGSVIFAKTLVCDLLQFPELKDITISLMDVDSTRLKVAETLMKRVVAKLGVPAKIEATMDRREAIRGAKYVLCTIQVGGYKPSSVRDFEIPKKYGVQQTIGDTLGIGGIFRGLRTIPVMVGIAKDIAEVAHPDCMFLNYTNPMAMNCWAVQEAVGIPHVGLCHSVFGTARMLANHAGLVFDDVSYLVAGVNHMAFFLQFKYRGQDAYPLLFRVLNDPTREFEKVRYEMMRRTGYFVTESSEHQAEYTPYFIHHGAETIQKFDIPIDEYLRRCEIINASWLDSERSLMGDESGIQVPAQSQEYGSYIIHSMETGKLRTVYGNVPNLGTIENLPAACNVEVPCQVDRSGLRPVRIGKLPPQLAALCQTQINVQDLTVQAALTGKREHIYHAAMLDPHTSAVLPLDKIWELCDELIEAHQTDGYLGDFAPVIKNTGRSYAGTGDRLIARLRCKTAYSTKQGAVTGLEAVVENSSAEPVECTLSITPEGDVAVRGAAGKTVRFAAGQTAAVGFEVENLKEIVPPCRVQLRSTSSNVLCQDLLLKPRMSLTPEKDGAVRCKLDLSGFPAVEAAVSLNGNAIEICARVNDSNIQVHDHQPWRKSSFELMFAPDAQSAPRVYYVVPTSDAKPKALARNTAPVNGISARQKNGGNFYELQISVPFEKAGLTPGAKEFLFNFGANLMALGEAHSGGRTALCPGSVEKVDVSELASLNFA